MAGLLLLFCSIGVGGEQTNKVPAKELVQYVREANRLGLSETDIQQNAVKAGWPAPAVTEAIAHVRAMNTAPPVSEPPSSPPPSPVSPAEADPRSDATAASQDQAPLELLPALPEEYRIGAGDVLNISVWKEPEASVGGVVVRPDGKISLPLIKDVEVVGLTPKQTEQVITHKLARLIPAADVTIVVTGINSKKIYLVGAINKEGTIPYTYRMTVMQAISEAGGLNPYAKRKKIYILRTENGKDYRFPFDYEAVLKGERMELNIPLLPNDTLVVPN